MGQGQAEVAMQLLHECSSSGEWLCLKNLHLVTAWLPTLEKVWTSDLNRFLDFTLGNLRKKRDVVGNFILNET